MNTLNNKITTGQGEYVVFHALPNHEKKELSRETFDKVYNVLLEFAPAAIINNETAPAIAADKCSRRYELIKDKIKQIDPSLEIAFIPKTLYELFFIKKCIKEDLKHKNICPYIQYNKCKFTLDDFYNNQIEYQDFLKRQENKKIQRKCWHLCFFEDAGNDHEINVKDVAYRLNQTIVKNLSPNSEGFTLGELAAHAENKIEFLKIHHKNCTVIEEKLLKGEQVESIMSSSTPGPTTNFGYESYVGDIKPMGIRDDADAEILRKAMALECSKEAQHSFILYRGSDFKDDSVKTIDDNIAYSLSYGTSLFAGCVYDGGATAFHFMRKKPNAYATLVPYNQLNRSPFYIPPTNTICQLFGFGESFHGRTKAWKFFLVKKIAGINTGGGKNPRKLLGSNLSKTELIKQFEAYKAKAIQLKK